MKIYSIDIETTGVDPKVNNILTIGAVIADLSDEKLEITNYFNKVFFKKQLTISSGAYKLNKTLLDWYFEHNEKYFEDLCEKFTYIDYDYVYYENISGTLYDKLILKNKNSDGKLPNNALIIGKNYDKFDREFLLTALEHSPSVSPISPLHRLLNQTSYDIGIACMDLSKDTKIPNTGDCLNRLQIEHNPDILHHSMYDAYIMMKMFAKVNGFEIVNKLSDDIFTGYDIN